MQGTQDVSGPAKHCHDLAVHHLLGFSLIGALGRWGTSGIALLGLLGVVGGCAGLLGVIIGVL